VSSSPYEITIGNPDIDFIGKEIISETNLFPLSKDPYKYQIYNTSNNKHYVYFEGAWHQKESLPPLYRTAFAVKVLAGESEQSYTIKIIEVGGPQYTVTHTAPEIQNAQTLVSTEDIAGALSDSLVALNIEDLTIEKRGSTLYFLSSFKTYTVEVSDSQGNTMMKKMGMEVEKAQDLLLEMHAGLEFKVHVLNSSEAEDDYFVEYKDGTWKESTPFTYYPYTKEGVPFETVIDYKDLPKKLSYDKDNSLLVIEDFEWADRKAGTEYTAPPPKFLKQRGHVQDADPIMDTCLYKNRLVVLSKHSLSFSKTGKFFDFFPESSFYLKDTDPFSITIDADDLLYLIPLQNTLLIFGKNKQFKINSTSGFTETSVAIDQFGSYNINPEVRPLLRGNELFFMTGDNNLVELFIDDARGVLQDRVLNTYHLHSVSFTQPSPRGALIPLNDDTIFYFNRNGDDIGWLYKRQVANQKIVLESFSKVEFDNAIALYNAIRVQDQMYTIHKGLHNNILLGLSNFIKPKKIQLENASHSKVPLALDLWLELTGTYDAVHDRTLIEYPDDLNYALSTDNMVLIENSAFASLEFERPYVNILSVPGNWESSTFYLGVPFTSKVELPTIYLKDRNGFSVTTGRTQLRTLILSVQDTGFFNVEEVRGTVAGISQYRGLKTGVALFDNYEPFTGKAKFPVNSLNENVGIKILAETHYPLHILDYSLRYSYTSKIQF
jgi:hypothetical protein